MRGDNLSQTIDAGPLKWEFVVSVLEDLARELKMIHARGQAYKNLQPVRIVLATGADGRLCAELVGTNFDAPVEHWNDPNLEQPASYMSPEQCRGEEADRRSDLYSLGCVAYECLTAAPPFLASTDVEVRFMHVNEDMPPFEEAAPATNVPPALEAIVFKLMKKNPDQRYQSATELLDDLKRFHEEPASLDALVNAMVRQRAAKSRSAIPLIVAALIGIFLVAAVAIAMSLPVYHHLPP